jgi:protein TonB
MWGPWLRRVAAGATGKVGPGKGDGLGPGDRTGFSDAGRAGAGGVSWPVRTYEAKPQYTAPAMSARIQGSVLIVAMISETGQVLSARVTRSLDSRFGLDAAAIQAVMDSKFTPCRKDGKPVRCVVPFELQFTLR